MTQNSASHPLSSPLAEAPKRFINRELSWLAFNTRVMEEAENPNNPLLERLKFLAISASNLDEFIMVRVAGLKDQFNHKIDQTSKDGLTPEQQLHEIGKAITTLVSAQQSQWNTLKQELTAHDIEILSCKDLKKDELKQLNKHFENNIFPALTPIAIDPAHPFPFLPNLSLASLFELKNNKTNKRQISIVPMPAKLPRFIPLAGSTPRFVPIEDAIKHNISMLFPGFDLMDNATFRVIRDSDLEIEEEAEDLLQCFESAVKQRRRGKVIHIATPAPVSKNLRHVFAEHLHVKAKDVVEVDHIVGMTSLFELYDIAKADLKYPSYNVRFPERINDYGGDCFAAINAKDIIVHHPFESFDVVVQFLRQAAQDPDVISIKQTLYRTSNNSPIVAALIEAAEAGKSVTALVELKARFDEEANMRWARDMERAGVQVVYGFVELKTHAKISLVTRQHKKKLKTYAHFGTGNYHPITAKVYTDLSFFTCDETLCQDAIRLFNFITGYGEPENLTELIAAPLNLRERLMALIDQEITNAKAGEPAAIWAKMNALVDSNIIDKLYEASSHGVQIDLVIRGICCLKPGVEGLSENIRVKSIVGRFLEHARIFCFADGHKMPSKKCKLFIASADWMPRNLDRRIESMVPIKNATVHAQVLNQIMSANMRDETQSWTLDGDGTYHRISVTNPTLSAHEYFMKNPSLSGRGKALHQPKSAESTKYKRPTLRQTPKRTSHA